MRPTQHTSNTRVLGAPLDHDVSDPSDPQYCAGLPITDCIVDGMQCIQSVWRPTSNEVEALVRGGLIVLTVVGVFHPMVRIQVTDTT